METKKVSKEVVQQRKINNGEAINKRILSHGAAVNAKCVSKMKNSKKK